MKRKGNYKGGQVQIDYASVIADILKGGHFQEIADCHIISLASVYRIFHMMDEDVKRKIKPNLFVRRIGGKK